MNRAKIIAPLVFFLFLGASLVYAERLLLLWLGTECTLLASISITGLLLAMPSSSPKDTNQSGFHMKWRGVSCQPPLRRYQSSAATNLT